MPEKRCEYPYYGAIWVPSKGLISLIPVPKFTFGAGTQLVHHRPLKYPRTSANKPLMYKSVSRYHLLIKAIIMARKRDVWFRLVRVNAGAEPEIFRLYFSDAFAPFHHENQKHRNALDDIICIPKIQNEERITQEYIAAEISSERSHIKQMTAFVLTQPTVKIDIELKSKAGNRSQRGASSKKFVLLDECEHGIFYDESAYIYLCIYARTYNESENVVNAKISGRHCMWRSRSIPDFKKAEEKHQHVPEISIIATGSDGLIHSVGFPLLDECLVSPNADAIKTIGENKRESCILYFYTGRNIRSSVRLSFQFETLPQIRELVSRKYGLSLVVQNVEQGHEPFRFLAITQNKAAYLSGRRPEVIAEGVSVQSNTWDPKGENQYDSGNQMCDNCKSTIQEDNTSGMSQRDTPLSQQELTSVFRIQQDERYLTIRCTQIPLSSLQVLITQNVYLFLERDKSQVHVGRENEELQVHVGSDAQWSNQLNLKPNLAQILGNLSSYLRLPSEHYEYTGPLLLKTQSDVFDVCLLVTSDDIQILNYSPLSIGDLAENESVLYVRDGAVVKVVSRVVTVAAATRLQHVVAQMAAEVTNVR